MAPIKHGYSKHQLSTIFFLMKGRCYNKNNPAYKDYGGRGITICDEWLNDSKLFFEWALNNGWLKGLHIDRIENNSGYSPNNCRFVTPKQNNRNKRNGVYLEHNGVIRPQIEWCEMYNIPHGTLTFRIRKMKMSMELALTTPTNIHWRELYKMLGRTGKIRTDYTKKKKR